MPSIPAKKAVPKKKSMLEKLRAVSSEFADNGGNAQFLKLEDGRNHIRILPAMSEDEFFYYKSVLHYGFRDQNGSDRAYPCFGAIGQPSCPVCKVIATHQNDDNPDAVKAIERLIPKARYMMNIVVRKTGEIKLLGAGKMIMTGLFNLINEDYGDITDEHEGYDIIILKTGQGKFGTKYTVQPKPGSSPLGIPNWRDGAYNLKDNAYREIPDRKQYIQMLLDQYGDTLNLRGLFKAEIAKLATAKPVEETPEEEEPEGLDEEEL